MRQHTPHTQGEPRPLPYFPAVADVSVESEPEAIDVDLNDLREPTPAFLLLEYRRRAEIAVGPDSRAGAERAGAEMDAAFEEAEVSLPDQPSRARSLAAKLVFAVVFGGILGLLGYELVTLGSKSFRPVFEQFHQPSTRG